ncbi:MAG: peptide ABC transporter substrate-binding protein [Acidobacteria bacterium]|nr:peptide ABC transporter substrate-binding protein [Acidobacteriota bacterium]
MVRATRGLGIVFPFGLLLAISLAGCQKQETEYFGTVEPPVGNVFRFSNGAEPEYLDPNLMTGQPDGRVARLTFEGLTNLEQPSLRVKPAAAESWEISPDQLLYTFHLRRAAQWADGEPVTAHDFVFSWTRILNPETASRYASHLYHLVNGQAYNEGKIGDAAQVGVRALDDYTLEVRLANPVPFFLQLTAFYTLLPIPQHLVEKHGSKWSEPPNVAGNGPFWLVEHRAQAKFEFVKNPRYWNAANVKLERVTAYSIDDNYTTANLYKAGVLDFVPSRYFPSEFVPEMRGRFRDIQSTPFLANYFYLVNVTRPPLNDPRVRRALSMAINRKAITDELLRGGETPGANFVPIGFPGYQSPPGPEFDPEQARRLLAEAGFPGGQGFREITILFNSNDRHRKVAEAIQQMWMQNLNIQVALRNEEWASYLKSANELNFDVARRGWITDYPDPSNFNDLLESTNGNNNTGWVNKDYDQMMAAARIELNPLRRFNILQQSEALLLREMPVLPIFSDVSNNLVKPYVRGFRHSPTEELTIDEYWIDHNWRANSPSGPIEQSRNETPAEARRGRR